MTDELEIGKNLEKAALSLLRYYPGIFLKGLKKKNENLSECSLCSDRDSNRVPPEYESGALPLQETVTVNKSWTDNISQLIIIC
jgi:hypothetical protein